MQTIAIANHKGGVAKTTTARNLGALLADRRRVLLVDLDPQAALTGACGITEAAPNLSDVIGVAQPSRVSLRDVIKPLSPTLALAPGDIALAASELGLSTRMGRESVLRKALATVAGNFDVCLIDCAPSLGMLTINALTAATGVLIPTQPQAVDLRALRLFLDTLESVKTELNPGLKIIGVLVTFYDSRLSHHAQAIDAMHSAGLPVLPTQIGRSVRLAEASAEGKAISEYAPDNPQAANYQELAKVIEKWLQKESKI